MNHHAHTAEIAEGMKNFLKAEIIRIPTAYSSNSLMRKQSSIWAWLADFLAPRLPVRKFP
jgi:hypothetical protein